MVRTNYAKRLKRRLQSWPVVVVLIVIFFIAGVGLVRVTYTNNLRPVSSSETTRYFTVTTGSGVKEIAARLKSEGLIRSAGAFESYVRTHELHDNLQAGTYILSPSMNVQQIVKKMVDGEVAKNLLTILPGKTLDEIKNAFAGSGYSPSQIDVAFDPQNYGDHPIIKYLPVGASLEGFLYPDSFQKLVDTPAETIVRQSLDEMQKHLSLNVVQGIESQGLSVYQGVILASIVEREVPHDEDRPIVAQVFLTRLKEGIKLESDATTKVFNTYNQAGLPPAPISNFSKSALNAVAKPASTTYLYFVSGDDNKTYFASTKQEHEDNVQKYCKTKCTR